MMEINGSQISHSEICTGRQLIGMKILHIQSIGMVMNKLISLILFLVCVPGCASEVQAPPKNLTDPLFVFNGSEHGSIMPLSRDLLKKLFKDESKNKYFQNINMWVFADIAISDSSRYLIVDGYHPVSPEGSWKGETEQLGGLLVLVKDNDVKEIESIDFIFNGKDIGESIAKQQLNEDVVSALAKDYVNKLIVFLGGHESAKTKFSNWCYISFQALKLSKIVEIELDRAGLLSMQQLKKMKELPVPPNLGNGVTMKGVRYVPGVNCPF
jgi:hypothetical protein